ncbi:hypothetical protein [Prescottella equi]
MAHPIPVRLARPHLRTRGCSRPAAPQPLSLTDRLERVDEAMMAGIDQWMNDHPTAASVVAAVSVVAFIFCFALAVVASSV